MGSKEDVCRDPGKKRRSGGRGRGLGIGRGRGPIGRMRTMEDVFEQIEESDLAAAKKAGYDDADGADAKE